MSGPTEATEAQPVWKIQLHEEVGSTNDLAGRLPGWNAVLARRQTGGRGRYRRSWVSDEGGLWLSAVLPTPGPADRWAILPLAAGWALRSAIASLGVENLRLRWPNDLMVGPAKLAGILVERFRPDAAVVGIGINLLNRPELQQPELAGQVTRLADLLPAPPPHEEVLAALLAKLTEAQQLLAQGQADTLLPSLNEAWRIRQVQITLEGHAEPLTGEFEGVDIQGNLLILDKTGRSHRLSPLAVALLRECA
jgi:BirA family biotin operon repressor/biotin-[acetyl-CoA-carboxylase] ligase